MQLFCRWNEGCQKIRALHTLLMCVSYATQCKLAMMRLSLR